MFIKFHSVSSEVGLQISFLAAVLFAATALAAPSHARMSYLEGIIPAKDLPSPVKSRDVVLLNVPHIRQLPSLCVPTSAAMVLRYFGENHSPQRLEQLAEGQKPRATRNESFTCWKDMLRALRNIGRRWRIRSFPGSAKGFSRGISEIEQSLRAGKPVLINVHLAAGPPFVVIGYDRRKEVAYIRDPDLDSNFARAVRYDVLRAHWHNHRFAKSRSAFFSSR